MISMKNKKNVALLIAFGILLSMGLGALSLAPLAQGRSQVLAEEEASKTEEESKKDKEKETDKAKETEKGKETETAKETEKETEKVSEKETEKAKETDKDVDKAKDKDKGKDKGKDKDKDKDANKDKDAEPKLDQEKEAEKAAKEWKKDPSLWATKSSKKDKTITVAGQGQAFTDPDIVSFNVRVETTNPDILKALADNTEFANALVKKLKDLGVADSDIQTSRMDFYIDYDYSGAQRTLRGYNVSQSYAVTLRKISDFSTIVPEVINEHVMIDGVQLKKADTSAEYQKAVSRALTNAEQVAETIAKRLGVKLDPIPKFVDESNMGSDIGYYGRDYEMENMAAGKGDGVPSLETGAITVNAQVKVVYQIVD